MHGVDVYEIQIQLCNCVTVYNTHIRHTFAQCRASLPIACFLFRKSIRRILNYQRAVCAFASVHVFAVVCMHAHSLVCALVSVSVCVCVCVNHSYMALEMPIRVTVAVKECVLVCVDFSGYTHSHSLHSLGNAELAHCARCAVCMNVWMN